MTGPSRGRHRIVDPDETTLLPVVVLADQAVEDRADQVAADPAEPVAAATPADDATPADGSLPTEDTVPAGGSRQADGDATAEDMPADTPSVDTPSVDTPSVDTRAEPERTPVPEPDTPTAIIPRIPAAETATTIFPAVPADTPTTIIPAVREAETPTTLLPAVPAEPPVAGAADPPRPGAGQQGRADEPALPGSAGVAASVRPLEAQHTSLLPAVRPAQQEETKATPRPRWNEKIVPLRAKRTPEGYQSIHSELTRTTAATVLRAGARGLGEVLITLGAIALLLFVYEVWGTTAQVDAQQDDMARQLQQQWSSDPTVGPGTAATGAPVGAGKPPAAGPKGIAILHIPTLGKRWVVVEGVRQVDIARNPGHYPGTAMPGQQGNFAVAGHRNRGTFWDLDKLRPCTNCGSADKIIVETGTSWFVYQVTQQRIVLPTAVEVVSRVPPGERPGKLLTLTTCHPLLDNYQRLIVHAKLLREQPKSAGRPAELGG